MNDFLLKIEKKISVLSRDEKVRTKFQYRAVYLILGMVSAFMSIVNIFTGKKLLLASTLVFAALCLVNDVLASKNERMLKLSAKIFSAEFILLFTFFIVSGTPEGFSAIWATMLPTCGLILFQRKNGSILSAIMFLIIIFLYWTPWGRSLLQYDYTRSFMLRFPMLYLACYLTALLLESMRHASFENYIYLCSHDALTNALNRKGFAEHAEKIMADEAVRSVGFMILDLDNFKKVNDTYGHFTGDIVLAESAKRIGEVIGVPVCRWGGEEFAAIFPGEVKEDMMDLLRKVFEQADIRASEHEIRQTISIGCVNAVKNEDLTMDDLCREADRCMYASKECGRNRLTMKSLA